MLGFYGNLDWHLVWLSSWRTSGFSSYSTVFHEVLWGYRKVLNTSAKVFSGFFFKRTGKCKVSAKLIWVLGSYQVAGFQQVPGTGSAFSAMQWNLAWFYSMQDKNQTTKCLFAAWNKKCRRHSLVHFLTGYVSHHFSVWVQMFLVAVDCLSQNKFSCTSKERDKIPVS